MTLNGYDISAYQHALDPASVPGDFVVVKVTGGDGYVNPAARGQIAAARAAGKLVGIYHFARDGYTAATAASEAEWFIRNAGDLCDGNTLVVLDWEGDNATDVAYAKAWLDTVTASTGVRPLIYMSFATINSADWSPVASADYGLWESAYVLGYQPIAGYNPPAGLAPIPYWPVRVMWQYTSTGSLPGWPDNLDLDLFYGDAHTWYAYAAKNGTVTLSSSNVTPLGGFLMALTDQQQTDLYNRIMGGIPSGDATKETGRLLDVNDLPAIAKAVHTYPVPHLDPATGQDDGHGTTLAAFVGAGDLQFVNTRQHVDAVGTAVKAIPVPQVTLDDAQVASLAATLKAELPPTILAALVSQLQKP